MRELVRLWMQMHSGAKREQRNAHAPLPTPPGQLSSIFRLTKLRCNYFGKIRRVNSIDKAASVLSRGKNNARSNITHEDVSRLNALTVTRFPYFRAICVIILAQKKSDCTEINGHLGRQLFGPALFTNDIQRTPLVLRKMKLR